MLPPPCVPLPAALPRIQGSSKALRKVSVIKAGETVLECKAMGTPLPTVTWVKDGQPVIGGDGILLAEQGRQLRIPKVEVAHAGRYTCLVANAVGQDRREFDITVHGRGAGQGWQLGGMGAGRLGRVVMLHSTSAENKTTQRSWTTQYIECLGSEGGCSKHSRRTGFIRLEFLYMVIRADHLMLHKVIDFPRAWGNLMGQGTKCLSWKRPKVAQGVWPVWCHTRKHVLGCAGRWHILAVSHLSCNTFEVDNFR